MIGTHFRHGTIRRYTAAFGSLFDNLSIVRYNNGVAQKEINVPLFYGPGQKYIIKDNSDHSSLDDKKIRMILPRMSFSLVGFQYNPARQPNKNILMNNDGVTQYNRVPYDFIYQLEVKAKNTEDGLQIVEQICPFFTPYLTISMVDNVDMGIKSDIQINLDSVQPEDQYEGSMEDRRELKWIFNFTLQGWLYKPTANKTIIKQATIGIDDFNTDLVNIDAQVNPLTASEEDPHTIDVIVTVL